MTQEWKDLTRHWDRHEVTWCLKKGTVKAEIDRQKNPKSGLIEWHGKVWLGRHRDSPIFETYTGQDFASCFELTGEAIDGALEELPEE